ncbi:hypothetical protein C0581_01075 [Candidatus Parcubacteria bacterium]|nr:MAG: hypothetical protein C0581_01075 [Candidatus Parcubacteria bacterium]
MSQQYTRGCPRDLAASAGMVFARERFGVVVGQVVDTATGKRKLIIHQDLADGRRMVLRLPDDDPQLRCVRSATLAAR